MTTGLQRQLALIEKRKAAGMKRFGLWLDKHDAEALVGRFPGPRNGINWPAVVQAALLWTVTEEPQPQAQPDDAEIERLQRKVRSLEKNATETAQRHRDHIADWRKLADAQEAKIARLEAELRNKNPGRLG